MPSKDLASGFGIVEKVQKDFPTVAYEAAKETAREAGLDPADPKSVAVTMRSKAFKDRVTSMAKNRDDRFLTRLTGNTPTLPDMNASPEAQEGQIASSREQTALNTIRARGVLGQRQMEAQRKLDEYADFDRESYTNKRLQELNPASDLDQRMLNIRMQAFTAKAVLRNELRDLPPALRNRVVAERMQVFSDTLGSLKEIRDARVSSAKTQINEEIEGKNEEIRTAKARVSSLKTLMDYIEQTGEDTEALASIRLDYLKEKKKLSKGNASGVTDEEETLTNIIINDYIKKNDTTPNEAEIKEAKRQAKEIVKRKQGATKTLQGLDAGTYKGPPVHRTALEDIAGGKVPPMGIPSRYAE